MLKLLVFSFSLSLLLRLINQFFNKNNLILDAFTLRKKLCTK